MSRILVVGNATLDIVHSVSHYPAEDEELRATSQRRQRGGNAANTAVVLAQHGHRVSFAGTLADDPAAQEIRADLSQYGVDLGSCQVMSASQSPLSCITHNQQTGSRTIVHYRDLPEYSSEAFAMLPLSEFDWFHFEGRNPQMLTSMLTHLQQVRVDQPISVEVEKERPGISQVFGLADVLLFSRAFAWARACDSAQALFTQVQAQTSDAILVCAWAEQGAYARAASGELLHQPARFVDRICDSVGAGDTFNAGLIHSLLSGRTLAAALSYANALAAKKLRQPGFAHLIESPQASDA
ncbi:MAG: PfkB family carbohydrate kinase [Gammaproteobacteria bacterium]